jgi:hypothetical protein
MADEKQVQLIRRAVSEWNKWRDENPFIVPALSGADLSSVDLSEANLSEEYLFGANLSRADLYGAYLTHQTLKLTTHPRNRAITNLANAFANNELTISLRSFTEQIQNNVPPSQGKKKPGPVSLKPGWRSVVMLSM